MKYHFQDSTIKLFKDKKILVTGASGMIGHAISPLLRELGAQVFDASLPHVDLTDKKQAEKACFGKDMVFHLAGIKGAAGLQSKKPASFLVPLLQMNTNTMMAAYQAGVERFLYTSSIGVYPSAPIFREDDCWKQPPMESDRFAGWAKRMGELQAEAMKIEYGWEKIAIVRPANVFGAYDNFDSDTAMVIPSLIRRVLSGENPLVVWGDGTAIRDFIYSKDVAYGMILAMKHAKCMPVNLGSGIGYHIGTIARTIIDIAVRGQKDIWFDTTKPLGEAKRVMDITRAKDTLGFEPQYSLLEALQETIEWYRSKS